MRGEEEGTFLSKHTAQDKGDWEENSLFLVTIFSADKGPEYVEEYPGKVQTLFVRLLFNIFHLSLEKKDKGCCLVNLPKFR